MRCGRSESEAQTAFFCSLTPFRSGAGHATRSFTGYCACGALDTADPPNAETAANLSQTVTVFAPVPVQTATRLNAAHTQRHDPSVRQPAHRDIIARFVERQGLYTAGPGIQHRRCRQTTTREAKPVSGRPRSNCRARGARYLSAWAGSAGTSALRRAIQGNPKQPHIWAFQDADQQRPAGRVGYDAIAGSNLPCITARGRNGPDGATGWRNTAWRRPDEAASETISPLPGAIRRVMRPVSMSANAMVPRGTGPIRNAISRGRPP